jgi:glycosyltransferase involved in cell wall biosynthesis
VTRSHEHGATPTAVHQFNPSASYGDAVSQSLLLTRDLLRSLGFTSEIYTQYADHRLGDELRPHREYPGAPSNVLLVHHAIGHDLVDWVLGLPDRKILVYHNITPPEFFPDDPFLQRMTTLGREQLQRYRPAMTGAFCDSQFNADELLALGYDDVAVLPLLLDTDRLRDLPWNQSIVDACDGIFTVLFVGRVERHKCPHDVIEVFRRVDRWVGRFAHCELVGSINPHTSYIHELRQRTASLALADRVRFPGHVSDEDLRGWYRAADVFVSMSVHEGFGMPLIEAMAFDVPVIAHASSSVPSTLDGAGILVEGKPLDEIAGLVCLLADDRALYDRVVARQRERVAAFSRMRLRAALATALAGVGIRTPVPDTVRPEPSEGEPCSASTTRRSAQRS